MKRNGLILVTEYPKLRLHSTLLEDLSWLPVKFTSKIIAHSKNEKSQNRDVQTHIPVDYNSSIQINTTCQIQLDLSLFSFLYQPPIIEISQAVILLPLVSDNSF